MKLEAISVSKGYTAAFSGKRSVHNIVIMYAFSIHLAVIAPTKFSTDFVTKESVFFFYILLFQWAS